MKAIIIVNGVISPGIDVGENCGIYVRKFKLMPIGSYVQLYDEKEPILEMAKISFYKLVSGVGLLVEVDVAERAFNILVEECTGKECWGAERTYPKTLSF